LEHFALIYQNGIDEWRIARHQNRAKPATMEMEKQMSDVAANFLSK
jgi:hypothetical protein